MADGSFRNENQQRALGLLNGIESEGWPSLQDKAVSDWSGGLNRQFFWAANSHAPAFSYINHKFMEPEGGPGDPKQAEVGFNIHRLVMAAAVLTDSALTYVLMPPGKAPRRTGIWDELVAGTERLRLDPTHGVVLAPNVPHAVEPDDGADLVLLVHHLRQGAGDHP